MFIGSNCCCGCDGNELNHIRFNCNELVNSTKDFSMDLSNILINYIDIEKNNTTLNPKDSEKSFVNIYSDFLIMKSLLPISIYDDKNTIINLDLKVSVDEVVINDYFIDIKYSIKKIVSNGYELNFNNGNSFVAIQSDFNKRFWSSVVNVNNYSLADTEFLIGNNPAGEYLLISERIKRINIVPNDGFDIYTFFWNDEFEFNGHNFSIELSLNDFNIPVQETYLDSIDINNIPITHNETIVYTADFLKISKVSVDIDKSMYGTLSLKHTPIDLFNRRNADTDTLNSYYSIGIFAVKTKIGLSNFAMIPLTHTIHLVNENLVENNISYINLVI